MNILPNHEYQIEEEEEGEPSFENIVTLNDGNGRMIVFLPSSSSSSSQTSNSNSSSSIGMLHKALVLIDDVDVDDVHDNITRQRRDGNFFPMYEVEELNFVETTLWKFVLPGGSCVTIASLPNNNSKNISTTANDGGGDNTRSVVPSWTTSSKLRNKIIEFMAAPPIATSSSSSEMMSMMQRQGPPLSPAISKVRYGGGGGKSGDGARRLSILNGESSGQNDEFISMKRSMSMPTLNGDVDVTNLNNNGRMGSPYSRIFPSLRTQVLANDGKYAPFKLNSQVPIPVETELFSGKFLLIMRPPKNPQDDDPYWNERIFSKKKRRVVMQLQGKLKYKPKGTLYAGMEISDPMNLGLIASGLCNIILKMTKSFNQELHYSFGDKNERAHICFPASTFFEDLVVTKPGDEPPVLGEEFHEPDDVAKSRKAYKTKIDWNTDDIYSMSFHSMYIDFPSWSVVRLPIGRDVALQTFWGNSSASVVLYEVDPTAKYHATSSNRYLLGVMLKYLGREAELSALEEEESDMPSDSDTDNWSEENFVEVDIGAGGQQVREMPAVDEGTEFDSDGLEFFDTVQSTSMFPEQDLADVTVSSSSSHNALLGTIDEFCPCWVDVMAKKGKYVTAYGFCGKRRPGNMLLRTVDMAVEVFGKRQKVDVDDRFSPRVSEEEQMRRVLGLKYAEAHLHGENRSKLNRFDSLSTRFDAKFLRRVEHTSSKVAGIKSGFVARALSDRHFIEERMVLRNGEILFHHHDRSKMHFKISLSSVVRVTIPQTSSMPLIPSYFFLSIEDFGRVRYVMFASREERDSWFNTLNNLINASNSKESGRSFTNHLIDVDDPMHDFLHKSTMWDCSKRRILNCRRYSFRTSKQTTPEYTMQLAERALMKVLSLQPKGPDDEDLRDFLDLAAALKDADAYSLSEDQKFAFFLNVYHTMIMHTYIVLGPPDSSIKVINYFNVISYQVSDDTFSIAELEHNIIRAEMGYPSNFLSRFILPKSQYAFAFSRSDFRINFALRAGSKSEPSFGVPIYKAYTLKSQLDSVAKGTVSELVSIKSKNGGRDVSVTLPKACQWFAGDFGPHGSASDVLTAIQPYLSNEDVALLRSMWNGKKQEYEFGLFNLKYLSYSFECGFLTLYSCQS